MAWSMHVRVLAPTLFFALVIAAFAGCTEDAGKEPKWTLRGTYTTTRTQADMEDLAQRVHHHGGNVVTMESFPEQFQASGMSAAGCDALHAELETVDYLSDLGSCSPARPVEDGNTPTYA